VSRSLNACEAPFWSWTRAGHPGADGVERVLAVEQGLELLPVINKIDLPRRAWTK